MLPTKDLKKIDKLFGQPKKQADTQRNQVWHQSISQSYGLRDVILKRISLYLTIKLKLSPYEELNYGGWPS